MQSRPTKFTIRVGGKVHEITSSTIPSHQETIEKDTNALEGSSVPSNSDTKGTEQNFIDPSSSEYSTDGEEGTPLCADSLKQMVLYDPSQNGKNTIESVENPNEYHKTRSLSKDLLGTRKGVPEVGAFTVQCAKCFKWRLIPTQEKYEEIREHITDHPFLCETTRQWGREVYCDDPTDIEQDGTRIWAIDKPNIAQPPPGWKRLLRIRSEGSSKFADVYYVSPMGAKLRSIPDVVRYLNFHPEMAQGIDVGRFSFQIPRPLQENYVKKRSAQMPAPGTPEYLEPSPVEPLAWAGPVGKSNLKLAEPLSWAGPEENINGTPPGYMRTPELDQVKRDGKKARRYDVDCL